jgi:uncharacterized protein (TIGR03492 family)
MNQKSKILFISNGYGEDTIACTIINELNTLLERYKKSVSILAFPLVGEGGQYKQSGIPIVSPTLKMPSGGLFPEGYLKNLWQDLQSGLAALTLNQIKTLISLKKDLKTVIAVGDIFPVIMAGLFTIPPFIFVGTAKSNYFEPYSPLEIAIFKKFCKLVIPRDDITAQRLKTSGVKSIWLGNAMMDGLEVSEEIYGFSKDRKVITILPGSRDFAYEDFPVIARAIEMIESDRQKNNDNREPFDYIAAPADSIDIEILGNSAKSAGFDYEPIDKAESGGKDAGILSKKRHNRSGGNDDYIEIKIIKGFFKESINMAHLVIGQAGTGNEQAAGLGKPVVAFDSGGKTKAGWYRGRQKGLLGDSLAVVSKDPQEVAYKAMEILENRELYKKMSRAGMERMGPSGGARRIAEKIFEG